MTRDDLKAALERRPRVRLGHLPTPIEPAPRLSAALGGPDIAVKRDDLTGLALGGNKVRQLEYLLGEALETGATAILTGAGVDSNHCRLLASACARLGLRACLILRGEPPARLEGNLLLDVLFGAEKRFIPADRFYEDFAHVTEVWSAELRAAGERPYVIDTLGWDSHSLDVAALGYVQAALEMEDQFEARGWKPDTVVFCSGAATQAGLVAAQCLLRLPSRLIGVSASPFIANKQAIIAGVATRVLSLLGDARPVAPREVINLDGYIGAGYGALTLASIEAQHLAACTEGLLLDPTYTAKAMAALIDHVRTRRICAGERVLFLHTGGAPAVFLARNEAAVQTRPLRRAAGTP